LQSKNAVSLISAIHNGILEWNNNTLLESCIITKEANSELKLENLTNQWRSVVVCVMHATIFFALYS